MLKVEGLNPGFPIYFRDSFTYRDFKWESSDKNDSTQKKDRVESRNLSFGFYR